jgi:hypothetical protein
LSVVIRNMAKALTLICRSHRETELVDGQRGRYSVAMRSTLLRQRECRQGLL